MSEPLDDRLDRIYDAVLDFHAERVAALVRAEVELGTEARVLLEDALIAAMDEVGEQFATGAMFVPEMLRAATAMKAGLEVLRPVLAAHDAEPAATVVIGTVAQDLHDIGKNLVGMMLEGAGFEVVDLGVDVAAERFVAAVREHHADLVALSALLTTTMPAMQHTVTALRDSGYNGHVLVGGAPINAEFATASGADGYAKDAPGAVALARRLREAAD